MHAILLFGGTTLDRFHQAVDTATHILHTSKDAINHHPDAYIAVSTPQTPITIAEVRQLKIWLSRSPIKASQKVVIIPEAELLTLPAQHALLKSLEEPPAPTTFILTTTNPQLLIDTIRSRCQLVTIKSSSKTTFHPESHTTLQKITHSSPGERLLLARDRARSREEALLLARELLELLRAQARSGTASAQRLEAAAAALKYLTQNVNPKLVLEDLFLRL